MHTLFPKFKTGIPQKMLMGTRTIKRQVKKLIPGSPFKFFPSIEWVSTPNGPAFPTLLFSKGKPQGSNKPGSGNRLKDPTRTELDKICSFLYENYGFGLKDNKAFMNRREHVKTTLIKRAMAINAKSYNEYFDLLKANPNELQIFLKQIVTLETFFFRTPAQFRGLEMMLPEIIERKKGQQKVLRIWCAGCATGEEAYSIAMLLKSIQGENPTLSLWNFEIYATDIIEDFLQTAKTGIYSARARNKIDVKNKENKKYLELFDRFTEEKEGEIHIKKDIKGMVKFLPQNVTEDFECSPDIIFCRNVLIYFTEDAITKVLERFHRMLPDGGHLFLGYSESIGGYPIEFESRYDGGFFHYQKPTAAAKVKEKIEEPKTAKPGPKEIPLTVPRTRHRRAGIQHPEMEKEQETRKLFTEAAGLFSSRKLDEAQNIIRRILELEPRSARARILLGRIYSHLRSSDRATKEFDDAISIDPLNADGYFCKAFVMLEMGKQNEAIKLFETAIYLEADFALAHFFKGLVYLEKNDLKNASVSFKNAKKLLEKAKEVKFADEYPREHYLSLCTYYINHIRESEKKKT